MSAQQAYDVLKKNPVTSPYSYFNRVILYFHRCDGANLTNEQAYALSQNMDGVSRVVKACLYVNDWYIIRVYLLLNEDCTRYSYVPYLPGQIKEDSESLFTFLYNCDWELLDEYWKT